jgi:hypothetical protein
MYIYICFSIIKYPEALGRMLHYILLDLVLHDVTNKVCHQLTFLITGMHIAYLR